jgi:hypothetical protein
MANSYLLQWRSDHGLEVFEVGNGPTEPRTLRVIVRPVPLDKVEGSRVTPWIAVGGC